MGRGGYTGWTWKGRGVLDGTWEGQGSDVGGTCKECGGNVERTWTYTGHGGDTCYGEDVEGTVEGDTA